ncbi:MAG: Trigger factor, partial [Mucilaginibacter sp.]|nr:Trigger factor [Mucilaginibacter sp.]
NANKMFDEVKALKSLDYIKSVVTLDKKEILYNDFKELVK